MNPASAGGEPYPQRALRYRILHGFPGPSDEAAWRDFLTRADWPSHYTSPEFFCEPFWAGLRPFAVLVADGDNIAAVLTGLHQADEVICGLPSRPQVCIDRQLDISRAVEALSGGLLEEAGSAKLITVFAWTPLDCVQHLNFRHRALEGNVVLDLTQGSKVLLSQCHENRRRNIRHASRHGVEVFQACSEGDFRAYYDVYRRWRHTARKQIEGDLVPFDVLLTAYNLRDSRRLFLARHAGRIIAGTSIRFARGGLLEYAGNSSLDEYLHLRPNDLLEWKTIEWGCEEGFLRYSLGGAHPFLRKTGGTLVPIHRHRFDRTWFRHHDRLETAADFARRALRDVPALDKAVRRLMRRQ
jgi:hypothetical protein